MATLTLDGDLSHYLDAFVDTFMGGIARGVGTSISASSGAPYASSLRGFGLFHPSAGDIFLNGTVTGLRLAEGVITDLTKPITFTEHLLIEDIGISATELFSFVSRTATTISGRFEGDVLADALKGYAYGVKASDNNDHAAPNAWIAFRGNDTFAMGRGDDTVDAGRGRDRIDGGAGADTLSGGAGRDAIKGRGGQDTLHGGSGPDKLYGAGGGDTLFGGGGNDWLDGGGGRNTLSGGGGADVFVFDGDGRDKARDFQPGVDNLHLASSMWSGNLTARQVIKTFGDVTEQGVVLAFGNGNDVTLIGLDDLAGLADDLVLV